MRPTRIASWAKAEGASGHTRPAATRSTASQYDVFRIALYLLLVSLEHFHYSDMKARNMPTLVYSHASVPQRSQECTVDVTWRVCTGPPANSTTFSYEP